MSKNGPPFALSYPLLSLLLLYLPTFSLLLPPPSPFRVLAFSLVALVVDDTNNLMSLYRNGAFEGSVAFEDSLSLLNDINNWLGRSQYVVDPSFSGTLHEFRIYDAALSAPAIQTSFLGGPDASFLD